MRNLFLSIAIFATTVVLAQENTQNNNTNILNNIQSRIQQSFGLAFQKQNPSDLIKLEKELTDIYNKKGQNIVHLSSTIKDNANEAISKDADNIRGYFACASNDFYTPERYGGGKKAEKYLLKAISLPAQKVKNPYLPSWGKEEAYEMIIKWYIRKKQSDKAKFYFKEASEKFPNNRRIKQLETQITGKKTN